MNETQTCLLGEDGAASLFTLAQVNTQVPVNSD